MVQVNSPTSPPVKAAQVGVASGSAVPSPASRLAAEARSSEEGSASAALEPPVKEAVSVVPVAESHTRFPASATSDAKHVVALPPKLTGVSAAHLVQVETPSCQVSLSAKDPALHPVGVSPLNSYRPSHPSSSVSHLTAHSEAPAGDVKPGGQVSSTPATQNVPASHSTGCSLSSWYPSSMTHTLAPSAEW